LILSEKDFVEFEYRKDKEKEKRSHSQEKDEEEFQELPEVRRRAATNTFELQETGSKVGKMKKKI